MTKRSPWWVTALIALFASVAAADDPWRAVREIPSSSSDPGSEPAATLEPPRSLETGASARPMREASHPSLATVSYKAPTNLPPPEPPPPTQTSADSTDPPTTQSFFQPPDATPPPTAGPPPPPPPPGAVPINQGAVLDKPLQHSLWDRCKELCQIGCGDRASATGRSLFQSDHSFDTFASPVTNPFLFEDPRALTEVKPLFIYAGAPLSNPIFRGGNAEYYGLQARLAVTDRLSMTINELGFLTLNPFNASAGPPGAFSQNTGFAQVEIGPKYTFFRSQEWKTVLAGGLLFQIPAGSPKVFQNTGTLGLVPYLSAAKNFCLPAGWGSTNLMGTTGYDFSVNDERSQFYYLSLHWDYNIANTNHFYPFLELNWFHYTQGGAANVPGFGFEGLGLVNFGSQNVGGRDFLGVAPGMRFKINECIQFGAAVTWPLLKQKEINDYTLTFDIIFRY